jgi:hypothetical protein
VGPYARQVYGARTADRPEAVREEINGADSADRPEAVREEINL